MRFWVLAVMMTQVSLGCKDSLKAITAPEPSPVLASASGPMDDDDDGAIEVPKELEAHTESSRTRLTSGQVVSKDLASGSKLSVRVKGTKMIYLGLSAALQGKKKDLSLSGAVNQIIVLDQDLKKFQIKLASDSEQTLFLTMPKDLGVGVTLSSITSDGGEIMEWKILAP
ncbi:MAG: hypothetical protein EOP10_06645 [Proteobacteria bacterium]|nr:MAG: hypothetical protein EOP10_06645 [Pseudomonadota bacterium]